MYLILQKTLILFIQYKNMYVFIVGNIYIILTRFKTLPYLETEYELPIYICLFF